MSKFKLPTQVDIFGTKYKVRKRKNFEHMGLCHKDTKLIEVEESLNSADMKLTFIHEILHATIEELSLGEVIDEQLEEIICDNFSKIICKIENQQITQQKKAAAAKKKKKKSKRKTRYRK